MVEKDKPLRESIKNLNAPAIIAFGNPLLDMFVKIKDNDLLKKYNLNVDGEAEFSEDKMQELLADIPQELIKTGSLSWRISTKYNANYTMAL